MALEQSQDEESDGSDAEPTWACLTLEQLKADLAECDQSAVAPKASGASPEDLRAALQREAGSFDADVFFAPQRALRSVAAQLQEFLVDAATQQLDNAALIASISYGPLRPPSGLPPLDVESPFTPPPRAPKLLDVALPSGAKSLAEYQQQLEAMPAALYLDRPVRLCLGEVDRPQDEKDIGRDELVVNGMSVSGAKGGYAAAHAAIAAGLRVVGVSEEAANRGAQLLLSVLNRTCSGFAAFEEVLRLFDCPDVVIVSPESAAAKPLEASMVGTVAFGRAHTRYAVRTSDGGELLATVDAVFTFRVTVETLQRLAVAEGDTWPSEELTAAVLLRRSSSPASGEERA